MIKNYLVVTLRNFIRNSTYSFINMVGLALGLTTSILMYFWVYDEVSFDRFHYHSSQLYRVVETQHYTKEDLHIALTPGPLGPSLKENFKEIQNVVRVDLKSPLLQYKELAFYEDGAIADPAFFDMFSFPILIGSPKTCLSDINNIVISESLAKKYFKGENAIGNVFKVNKLDFVVTGIFQNIPENSQLKFDFVVPFESFRRYGFDIIDAWGLNLFYTYTQLQDGASPDVVDQKIRNVMQKNIESDPTELSLQPLTAVHLSSDFSYDLPGNGNVQYVYIISVAAIFILLIACINFMNLSTAKSAQRSKEVGIRKVVGASRNQLIRQFLMESILMSFGALILALIMVNLLLPVFNSVSRKNLAFNFESIQFLVAVPLITLVTGLIAGSYPALFISSLKPVTTLNGIIKRGTRAILFRKVLVIAQFSCSISLIIGTLIVDQQLGFIRKKNLGFEKRDVISFEISGVNPDVAKNEFLSAPGITGVTFTSENLTNIQSAVKDIQWEGKSPGSNLLFYTISIDEDFTRVLNINLKEGRNFANTRVDSAGILLNEEAVLEMGIADPINKNITFRGKNFTILGVVKDFHFKSIHQKIEPLILFPDSRDKNSFAYIKLGPNNSAKNIALIQTVFKRLNPERPFDYSFLEEDLNRLYQNEQQTADLFTYASWLAIFISCLGLYGLVLFTTEQRTKELGVRKVMGASISNLFLLVSKDFLILIAISNVIAIVFSSYVMKQWLNNFSYRVELSWTTFVVAAFMSLSVALITLSFQSMKAAATNPVQSLRFD